MSLIGTAYADNTALDGPIFENLIILLEPHNRLGQLGMDIFARTNMYIIRFRCGAVVIASRALVAIERSGFCL